MTILAVVRFRIEAVPFAVGLYITAAYWFTASTSFANPAVTLARALTDTFAGIAPNQRRPFVIAQVIGRARRHGRDGLAARTRTESSKIPEIALTPRRPAV